VSWCYRQTQNSFWNGLLPDGMPHEGYRFGLKYLRKNDVCPSSSERRISNSAVNRMSDALK
jgi:hypothetical protein